MRLGHTAMSYRCPRHDLATAPDGLCVLCRREHDTSDGSLPVGKLLGALLLLVALFAGLRAATRPSRTTDSKEMPAASIADVRVIIYSTSWCPHCRTAKKWMTGKGVRFEERDVESNPANLADCQRLNPRCSIPTLDVGGEAVVGFDEATLRAALQRAAKKQTGS